MHEGLMGDASTDEQEEDDGTLLLTQSGLINCIIEAMDLKNTNPKNTPAMEAIGMNK
jgi:hypothetical protein